MDPGVISQDYTGLISHSSFVCIMLINIDYLFNKIQRWSLDLRFTVTAICCQLLSPDKTIPPHVFDLKWRCPVLYRLIAEEITSQAH